MFPQVEQLNILASLIVPFIDGATITKSNSISVQQDNEKYSSIPQTELDAQLDVIHQTLFTMVTDSLLAVVINDGNFFPMELKPMQAIVEALRGITLQQPTWSALGPEETIELENRQKS
ncbi:hypothetical protein BDK51DRAFT_33589, partial [Blyttiomyces helicus]